MIWDESDHPRIPKGHDGGGRFTDKTNAERLKESERIYNSDGELGRIKRERFSIPLDFFAVKNPIIITPKDEKRIRANLPEKAFGFADKERLNTAHHKKHAAEMGYNSKQYEKAAVDYWNKGVGKCYYSPVEDRYYKYNEKTLQFVSVDKDGVVHTFMLLKRKRFDNKMVQERLYDLL